MAMRAQTERAETGQRATARRSILFRSLAGLVRRFAGDISGATVVEYTLIAGLTFLAIVGALRYYADRTEAMYQRIGTAVSGAT